jgi:hypothetical protein
MSAREYNSYHFELCLGHLVVIRVVLTRKWSKGGLFIHHNILPINCELGPILVPSDYDSVFIFLLQIPRDFHLLPIKISIFLQTLHYDIHALLQRRRPLWQRRERLLIILIKRAQLALITPQRA